MATRLATATLVMLALLSCAPDEPERLTDAHDVDVAEQAVTYESFAAYELPSWDWADRYRSNSQTVRFAAAYPTSFGLGDNGGEKNFWVQNTSGVTRPLDPIGGAGAVEWYFDFPAGSPCKANPTTCTYWVCISEGIPWPRCIETGARQGSTFEFNNEAFAPYAWIRFTFIYRVDSGAPTQATTQRLILRHSAL